MKNKVSATVSGGTICIKHIMLDKKFFLAFLLFFFTVSLYAQNVETLDNAIKTVAERSIEQIILRNIPEVFDFNSNTISVAIMDFDCSSKALSEYIVSELTKYFLRNMKFTPVERKKLDNARRELKFNMSSDVDDNSAQRIGKFVGAKVVIFGTVKPFGKMYRMEARAIAVEKGIILAQENVNIREKDIKPFMAQISANTKAEEKIRKTEENKREAEKLFEDYSFFNYLLLLGYTYTPNAQLGFSIGVFGVYTSWNFAVPDWGRYQKREQFTSDSHKAGYYDTEPYIDRNYEIINWTVGYNITVIPNILYLPIGGGVASVKEWRLQNYGFDTSYDYKWIPPSGDGWKNTSIIEAGLLLKIPTEVSPYLSGTYRYKGTGEHSFSVSVGICCDFLH
jgi:hypothetical protein